MNRLVREKLRDLVAADTALLRNAGRMRTQLLEAVPGASREVAALSAAVEENVPPSISRSTGSLSVQGSLDRTARSLAENRALSLSAATWAVGSWAWALHKGPEPDDSAGDGRDGSVTPMRAAPRRILREILTRYGPDIQRNPFLLRALLSDLVPGYRREQAALVAAAEEGVPAQVSAAAMPAGALPADRLADEQALNPDAAAWAVASWAWALDRGPEPHDVATSAGADTPASVPPFTPSPAPPRPVPPRPVPPQPGPRPPGPRPPGSRGQAAPPPPPSVPTPGPYDGREFVSPAADLEKPPRRRRGRTAVILVAVLAVLGLGLGVAIAANQDNDDSYSYGGGAAAYPVATTTTPDDSATTPDDSATTPDDSSTTPGSTWADVIAASFVLPSSGCREATPDIDGMEYATVCDVTADANGNALDSPIQVRYAGWSSVSAIDDHFDKDKTVADYSESTWWFGSDSSDPQGRLIQFTYNGQPGLDWSYEREQVTGEAITNGGADDLRQWWKGITRQ